MRIRKIGQVAYQELGEDAKIDVAYAVGLKKGELQEGDIEDADVMEEAVGVMEERNPRLPLVEVNPEDLLRSSTKSISKVAAKRFSEMMMLPTEVEFYEREGLRIPPGSVIFPPVVIDSSLRRNVLREGGHRTLAAKMLGIPWITAIDIAKAR